MKKDIVIHAWPSADARWNWVGYILIHQSNSCTSEADVLKSHSLSEIITNIRQRVVERNYILGEIIAYAGDIKERDMPEFFSFPRTLSPGMIVIDDLFDDSDIAMLLLTIQ